MTYFCSKRFKERLITFLILITTVLTTLVVMSSGVSAAEAWDTLPVTRTAAEENGMYFYDVSATEVGLLAYTQISGNTSLMIPSSVDGKRVSEIGEMALANNTEIVSVSVPPSVKTIKAGAFLSSKISSVILSEGLEKIENNAFRNTRLSSVVLPESLTSLGYSSFGECSLLTSVTVNGALTEMYEPFSLSSNLSLVKINSCLADTEKIEMYSSSAYTGGAGAEIDFVGHEVTSSWSSWTSTHNRFDLSGNSLWNGNYRHYRTATCSVCGLAYEFEACSFNYPASWTYYSTQSHSKTSTCSVCGEESVLLEDHDNFTAWKKTSASKHSRTFNCSICGKSGTQTSSHNFVTGSWAYKDAEKHSRSKTCTLCGYSEATTARHTYAAVSYEDISDSEHKVTEKCPVCSDTRTVSEAHADGDGNGLCDKCGHIMAHFSVTVPLSIPVVMDENGNVTAAEASVINNSSGDVSVTSVLIEAEGEWTLVPFTTDMADEKVDSSLIGIYLNGEESTKTGKRETFNLSSPWIIGKGEFLPLVFRAVISPVSRAVTGEKILNLTFTVSWRT